MHILCEPTQTMQWLILILYAHLMWTHTNNAMTYSDLICTSYVNPHKVILILYAHLTWTHTNNAMTYSDLICTSYVNPHKECNDLFWSYMHILCEPTQTMQWLILILYAHLTWIHTKNAMTYSDLLCTSYVNPHKQCNDLFCSYMHILRESTQRMQWLILILYAHLTWTHTNNAITYSDLICTSYVNRHKQCNDLFWSYMHILREPTQTMQWLILILYAHLTWIHTNNAMAYSDLICTSYVNPHKQCNETYSDLICTSYVKPHKQCNDLFWSYMHILCESTQTMQWLILILYAHLTWIHTNNAMTYSDLICTSYVNPHKQCNDLFWSYMHILCESTQTMQWLILILYAHLTWTHTNIKCNAMTYSDLICTSYVNPHKQCNDLFWSYMHILRESTQRMQWLILILYAHLTWTHTKQCNDLFWSYMHILCESTQTMQWLILILYAHLTWTHTNIKM